MVLSYFMKTSAVALFTAHLSLAPQSSHYSVKKVLEANFQLLNHLLRKYGTNYIISAGDSDFARFKLLIMSPLEFLNNLSLQALRCPYLY